MNIQECQELDPTPLKCTNAFFQAGTQRRSVPNFKLAIDLARKGRLGQDREVHAGILKLREYLEPLARSTRAGSIDYQLGSQVR